MKSYANENDSSLSVPLSPCSVLLPGCSSPVASSWWLLEQADPDLFLYRPGATLTEKTQSRAGCFSTSWLTLLCQPLQLFVLFWWDMKVKLDGISSWDWKSRSAVVILLCWCFWHPWGKHCFASWYTVITSDLFAKVFHQVTFEQSTVLRFFF